MLSIPQIRQIVTKIGKKYGIKSAYLFGSYAKGAANEKSDVDLIIDMKGIKRYKNSDYRALNHHHAGLA